MIYGEYIFKAMSQADDREATARGWDELVRCKDCKRWKRNDGTFPDFDGKEWHTCEALDEFRHRYTSKKPEAPAWFYCGYAERKEE